MSNPYDPDANPYGASYPTGDQGGPGGQGANPYGSGADPYGQGGGYGTPYGGGPGGYEAPKKTDAVSITGFVLSLTCFLSPIGFILGLVGLSRTKGGQRKGRWAAITAVIVGLIFSIILGLLIFGGAYLFKHVVTVDNAKTGQCVDVTENDDDTVGLFRKDCSSRHDAEVVYVGTAGADAGGVASIQEFCLGRVTDTDPALGQALTTGGYKVQALLKDTTNVSPGDKLLCYAESGTGAKLTGEIAP